MSSIAKIFKKKDKSEEIIDSVKDALDDIRAMPKLHQILIGGSGGLVSGYVVKRAGRVAAITLGGTIILLQAAQHFGYVNINWKKVQKDLKKKADKAVKAIEQSSGVTDQESFDRLVRNTKIFVKDNLTFGLSFLGGVFIGIAL
jgi:FUN14 domain-containing protein 1